MATGIRVTQNSPYEHYSYTTLNVVLPPTRTQVEMYSYINAASHNSALLAENNGTTSPLPLYENTTYSGGSLPYYVTGTYLHGYDALHKEYGGKYNPAWTSHPRAYLNEEGSGFRAKVTNDSDYNVTHGVNLFVNVLTQTTNVDANGAGNPALLGNVGFRTTHLTLSRALLDATEHQQTVKDENGNITGSETVTALNGVTFYWVPRNNGLGAAVTGALPANVHSSSYSAEDVLSWFANGTMAPVVDNHTEPAAADDSLCAIAVPTIDDTMNRTSADAALAAAVARPRCHRCPWRGGPLPCGVQLHHRRIAGRCLRDGPRRCQLRPRPSGGGGCGRRREGELSRGRHQHRHRRGGRERRLLRARPRHRRGRHLRARRRHHHRYPVGRRPRREPRRRGSPGHQPGGPGRGADRRPVDVRRPGGRGSGLRLL